MKIKKYIKHSEENTKKPGKTVCLPGFCNDFVFIVEEDQPQNLLHQKEASSDNPVCYWGLADE